MQRLILVSYLFGEDSRLKDIYRLENTNHIKNLKFKGYLYKRQCLDRFANSLKSPGTKCLVYLGKGYLAGSNFLPGNHPSPKGLALKDALIRNGITVVEVDERNTSLVSLVLISISILILQVCSKCLSVKRLVPLGSSSDHKKPDRGGFPYYNYPLKVCLECDTIFNRDDNAASNIFTKGQAVLLGRRLPDCFTTRLL